MHIQRIKRRFRPKGIFRSIWSADFPVSCPLIFGHPDLLPLRGIDSSDKTADFRDSTSAIVPSLHHSNIPSVNASLVASRYSLLWFNGI